MADAKGKKKSKEKDKTKPQPDDPDQQRLKRMFPEFARLPEGWIIKTLTAQGKNQNRVCYSKEGETDTWTHPSRGALPPGWEVRMFPREGTGLLEPKYCFLKNGKWRSSLKDPRLLDEVLKKAQMDLKLYHGSGRSGEKSTTQIAGSVIKMSKKKQLGQMRRADVSKVDISDAYEYLHCIDTGMAGRFDVGGMNGGVFVVRLKRTSLLFVEKRFRMGGDDREFALNELRLMHRVKHPALTFFSNGYATKSMAAVYMEFCDRGSLKDIMDAYRDMRAKSSPDNRPRVPEKFLWHCFVGLCDALAFLRTGLYYVGKNIQNPNKIESGWVPILHRDIKPDNILLKSRTQSAERKYFYCTLSDFGLACEDYPDGDSRQDYFQKSRSVAGTPYWFAPELCHNPYPTKDGQEKKFAGNFRHSQRTDLWALGTIIYNLAECDKDAHINWSQQKAYNINDSKFRLSKVMHVEPKIIKLYYSKELRDCIREATAPDPSKRPKPTEMVIKLMKKAKQAIKGNADPQNEDEMLPNWATKVHEYHTKKGKTREQSIADKQARDAEKEARRKQGKK